MYRVGEFVATVNSLPRSLRVGGTALLAALAFGHSEAPAESIREDSRDTFAHQSFDISVTGFDKEIALHAFPNVRPLRLTKTEDGQIKPFYGPVKDGPFEEAGIHTYAAYRQRVSDENNKRNCAAKLAGRPTGGYGVMGGVFEAYAWAKGYIREIPVTYEPGNRYLHADIGNVPSGVDHRNEIFAVFDGKQYTLDGEIKYMPDTLNLIGRENLRLKVPEEVGPTPYIDPDRYSC